MDGIAQDKQLSGWRFVVPSPFGFGELMWGEEHRRVQRIVPELVDEADPTFDTMIAEFADTGLDSTGVEFDVEIDDIVVARICAAATRSSASVAVSYCIESQAVELLRTWGL